MPKKTKILLFTKTDEYCKIVQRAVKNKVKNSIVFEAESGLGFPIELKLNHMDISEYTIISFLSPWIIPNRILEQSKLAINFHPAPPKYPGIGCYNFAIYNREKEYGVTSHIMLAKPDTGRIIKVKRFPMYGEDTVFTLKYRTMDYLLRLFYEIFDSICNDKDISFSNEKWGNIPFTHKDLEQFCKLDNGIDNKALNRLIQATYYPGAKDLPYFERCGYKFRLDFGR